MVTFPDVPLGIFLFCVCVIAIGAVQVLDTSVYVLAMGMLLLWSASSGP